MDEPTETTPSTPVMAPSGWLGGPATFSTSGERKIGPALVSSLILHGVLLVCLVVLMSYHGNAVAQAKQAERIDVLYLPDSGAGGGGGGRPGLAPPRKMELPTPKPAELVQPAVLPTQPPIPILSAPVTTLADLLQASGTSPLASPNGGGGGRSGIAGPGDGPGAGPGRDGSFGDGAVGRGPGIKDPVLLHEQKPIYTPDAIRMKLQGIVAVDVTVMPDGSVNPRTITVSRSLDRQFGLDEQAVAAAKLWRFVPAVNLATGERVPFRVTIEMTFTLR